MLNNNANATVRPKSEPVSLMTLNQRLVDLIETLLTIEVTQREIREKTLGSFPEDPPASNEPREYIPLCELIDRACFKAANLSAEARMIADRL